MSRSRGARDTFAGLARGFGGSILFALPLLMTMEMWWLGFYLGPTRILLLMAVFFPILIGVAHYIGFRDTDGAAHAALHAITAYGIAILSSGVMLGILGVLKPGMGWQELVGKTAIQAGPGALGALLAESHFGASDDKKERRDDAAYVEHLFFMVVGALFVALTVAPTDEMPLIGYMMHHGHTVVAVGFSLALLHFFMHGVGFEGHAAAEPGGGFSTFFRLALVGYSLALLVSAFLLYVFGRFDDTQLAPAIHMTVVLGVPATVGGAAPRPLPGAPGPASLRGRGDRLWRQGAGLTRLQSPFVPRAELERILRLH